MGRGCLERGAEHREAACGFRKKGHQGELAAPVAGEGGRGPGHAGHCCVGLGASSQEKAVSHQIQSGSESHNLDGLQEPGKVPRKKKVGRRSLCHSM